MSDAPVLSTLSAEAALARLPELAELLHACIRAGANINFVLPFERADSEAFWRETVVPPLAAGRLILWAAEIDGRLAGSVQLVPAPQPNQPHRAEVAKLMTHPAFRRRGVARALMAALEAEARRRGHWLITLDTRTGDKAEPLYAALGYQTAGRIPDFCRDPIENRLWPTTIMWKRL